MSPYIALVDDDPEDQMLLADALKNEGFKYGLQFFSSGKELINKLSTLLEKDLPYLIIMDQNMPGEDGSEILKQIKKSEVFKTIPTIVLTGSVSWKSMGDIYSFGASCVLQKPSTFDGLRNIATCISRLWQPIRK